jgi:hypothetical protein
MNILAAMMMIVRSGFWRKTVIEHLVLWYLRRRGGHFNCGKFGVAKIVRVEPSGFTEALASLCHEQWSGWMRYLFGFGGTIHPGDQFLIDKEHMNRWLRQMNTPYDELSELEKMSDGKEALKFIRLMERYGLVKVGKK